MSFETHPAYGYGLAQAVKLARALGEPAMSALELGVAGGNGLAALERFAGTAPVPVQVAGFDTGAGLPAPVDYRDLPYVWRAGDFVMDEPALRARLSPSTGLVLGDVGETLGKWLADGHPPVGFAAFDLDYYSSTAAALASIAAADPGCFLPRVWCYFDDVVGPDAEIHSEFTGELLAIAEFNTANAGCKIAQVNGLRWKVGAAPRWIAGMFVLHLFTHPRYCDYVLPSSDRQLPLAGEP